MNIKNRQQLLVVLALAAVALYAVNWLVFEPMAHWWRSRETRIAQLRQQVHAGRTLVRREAAIRDQWQRMRANALPNDASLAEQQVLRAFDDWARQSGVNINSIIPQWQNDETNYSTLDCRVEAAGDLETLSRFVYAIENDPMPLQLQSVELAASDEKGQQLTLGLQVSGLALVAK